MIDGKKVVVVLPAFKAAKTLAATVNEIPFTIVDEIILTDDASPDATVTIAQQLAIQHILIHQKNKGYGGNQKTCYQKALALDAAIIVMLHPDYQYTPKLIPAMAHLIASDVYDVVLGSRILGNTALKGGMPVYKYVMNRALTFVQNILQQQKLSEYHTGYRAFNSKVLKAIKFENNSNDFVFDNQLLSQIIMAEFKIGEISCPTHYAADSSSINFLNSLKYGWGCMQVACIHFLHRHKILKSTLYT
jgi:glycosyltransferase involved in cell wall biosynthesis